MIDVFYVKQISSYIECKMNEKKTLNRDKGNMEDEKKGMEDTQKKEVVLISNECGKKIELDLNDEKWSSLRCETGDEMECTYIMDQNNTIIVEDMKFPDLYSGKVYVSSKESIVEVIPLFTRPSEKREKVRNFMNTKTNYATCFQILESFFILLWKAGEDSKQRIHPREGDIVRFQLQFANNEWHPKALKIMPHNPLFCFFFFFLKKQK
ncbi:hypothetical protein RFI_11094 [Reticulomyxa filosa]|uniref:Uncharacterized protein n=1 Tax=Reticulomyxa filosa TaxID=46433 RepID=X6NKY2_RETFI|nr:hypothetical protein RFI_11094 [Reticulomyxa filosa]|eukprot:ETO26042.1 hypothetical protein RFI_11094 [Reticulomyxa filosa]